MRTGFFSVSLRLTTPAAGFIAMPARAEEPPSLDPQTVLPWSDGSANNPGAGLRPRIQIYRPFPTAGVAVLFGALYLKTDARGTCNRSFPKATPASDLDSVPDVLRITSVLAGDAADNGFAK